jgi:hypothetical protein
MTRDGRARSRSFGAVADDLALYQKRAQKLGDLALSTV